MSIVHSPYFELRILRTLDPICMHNARALKNRPSYATFPNHLSMNLSLQASPLRFFFLKYFMLYVLIVAVVINGQHTDIVPIALCQQYLLSIFFPKR